jgi:hypothetical protein
VLLATLARRMDPEAERIALESAYEANRTLLLVNAVLTVQGPAATPRGGGSESVVATAKLAGSLGIRTELLRPMSPSPARSIVMLANARRVALVVLGRPRGLIGRWRFRRAARAIRRDTSCLVWIAPG